MKMYLAGGNSLFKACVEQGATLENTNVLQSFVECNDFVENVIIPTSKSFMLDSGAFTYMNGRDASQIDWNDYIDRYAAFINRNNVDLFFELDIDVIVGYPNVLKLRKKLEEKTGKRCIPVFHRERGREEFEKMCDEYDYVALGGIAIKDIRSNEFKYFKKLVSEAHRRGAKIHGLGFTPRMNLLEYGFDSVDSTSWTIPVRYGSLCRFNGHGVDIVKKPEGKRLIDYKQVALHSFNVWTKYGQYLEGQ